MRPRSEVVTPRALAAVASILVAALSGAACLSSAPAQQQQSPPVSEARATPVVRSGATSVPRSEEFGRAVTLGWNAAALAHYQLFGPAADFGISGAEGTMRNAVPGEERGLTVSDVAERDVQVTVRVRTDRAPSGGDEYVFLLARVTAPASYYLGRLRFDPEGGAWLQGARMQDGNTELLGGETRLVPSPRPTDGVWMSLAVSGVSPTTLRLKAWTDGQPEPATWSYTTEDAADLRRAGAVGVRSYLSRRADNAPVIFRISGLHAQAVNLPTDVATAGVNATPIARDNGQSQPVVPATPRAESTTGQSVEVAGASSTASATASPLAAVDSFYSLVQQKDVARAAQLWTQDMRAKFPPAENITRRFSHTRQLVLEQANVETLDERMGRATVAIVLREVLDEAPFERRYSGTWDLVRGDDGWRLDQPDLKVQLQS